MSTFPHVGLHSPFWQKGLTIPCFCFFCYPQPTNHMNSSLTSLYRKGNPDSSTCSPRRDQPAACSPSSTASLPPSAGTLVSTGGWFIDKGRGPEKSNIFIDLCEEEPSNTATNVCSSGVYMSHKQDKGSSQFL